MKLKRLIAISVIAGSLGIHAAGAKTLRNSPDPAEFPPASYKGKQYVDSRGCVFIRAGIDGRVNWVPRVSRDRTVICGFKPTLAAGSKVAPAPTVKPTQKPVQITLKAAPTPQKAKPAPVVRRVTAPLPVIRRAPTTVPAPRVVRAPQVVAAPAKPRRVATPAPRPRVIAQNMNSCAGWTGISGALNRHSDFPVRCGPQAENPAVFIGRYNTRLPASPGPVLNSDTMNLNGEGRRNGPQEWSPTEFRGRYNERLPVSSGPIRYLDSMARPDQRTQRQVASTYRRGYTQPAAPQVVASDTRIVRGALIPKGYLPAWKDDRLNTQRGNGIVVARARQAVQPAVQAAPRISTRSAPAQAGLKRDVIRASVQVGVYRDKGSAQSIARKVQRLGLPVRIGLLTRGAEQLRIVVAGPFGSQNKLSAALGKVQRAGYRDAVIRR